MRLKELRSKKHLTQQKLADILGVSRSALASWESGVNYPEVTTLQKIADYFNVSTDYLLERVDRPNEQELLSKPVTTDYLLRDNQSENVCLAIQWFKFWQHNKEEFNIRSNTPYEDEQVLEHLAGNAKHGKEAFEKFYNRLSDKEKKEVDELLNRIVSLDAEESLLIQYYRKLDERGKRSITDALMREYQYIHADSLSKKNNSIE